MKKIKSPNQKEAYTIHVKYTCEKTKINNQQSQP